MNRALTAGAILLSCTLLGCGRKDPPSASTPTNPPAAGGNPLTAPVDYLGAVAKAKTVSEKTLDLASLNQAIQLFQASEGRLPKDLDELVAEKYLPRLPAAPNGMKIVYNPARGQVSIVPQ